VLAALWMVLGLLDAFREVALMLLVLHIPECTLAVTSS
jgi:hypothetical protein